MPAQHRFCAVKFTLNPEGVVVVEIDAMEKFQKCYSVMRPSNNVLVIHTKIYPSKSTKSWPSLSAIIINVAPFFFFSLLPVGKNKRIVQQYYSNIVIKAPWKAICTNEWKICFMGCVSPKQYATLNIYFHAIPFSIMEMLMTGRMIVRTDDNDNLMITWFSESARMNEWKKNNNKEWKSAHLYSSCPTAFKRPPHVRPSMPWMLWML